MSELPSPQYWWKNAVQTFLQSYSVEQLAVQMSSDSLCTALQRTNMLYDKCLISSSIDTETCTAIRQHLEEAMKLVENKRCSGSEVAQRLQQELLRQQGKTEQSLAEAKRKYEEAWRNVSKLEARLKAKAKSSDNQKRLNEQEKSALLNELDEIKKQLETAASDVSDKEANLDRVQNQLRWQEAKVAAEKSEMKIKLEALQKQNEEIASKNQQEKSVLQNELDKIQQKLENAASNIKQKQEDLNHAEAKLSKKDEELQSKQKNLALAIERLNKEKQHFQSEITGLNIQVAQSSGNLERLQEEAQSKLEECNAAVNEVTVEKNACVTEKNVCNEELHQIRNELALAKQRFTNSELEQNAQNQTLREHFEGVQHALLEQDAHHKAQVAQIQNQMQENYKAQVAKIQSQLRDWEAEVAAEKSEMEQMKIKLKALQEENVEIASKNQQEKSVLLNELGEIKKQLKTAASNIKQKQEDLGRVQNQLREQED